MTNREIFARMQKLLPGGVNSPVRAFKAVGGEPVVLERADGPYVWDVEGNRYIDFVGSWGPMIHGHNHPAIREAAARAAESGMSFGAPCAYELALAERVIAAVPGIDVVRFVSSGTEATMTAARLARAATGRDVIVKVDGGYHGHADPFLVAAGSGATTFGTPDSPGVPRATAALTRTVPFNDAEALESALAGAEVACFIVEPVPGNMGVVLPEPGYLQAVQAACRRNGTLLIYDEVITGFRLGPGGAQGRLGVVPDLTTLGKIIGGGMPVGALGGRRELMERLAPAGPVYQAGTLSGNPVAMAAGAAALALTESPRFYDEFEARASWFFGELRSIAGAAGACVNSIGSMGTLFFCEGPVTDYAGAKRSDTARYAVWFHEMLRRGIYLPPSQFEALFVSAAHDRAVLDSALEAAAAAIRIT